MWELMRAKRFAPFFWTMGLGALNDNIFKTALVILIAYQLPPEKADIMVQLAAGLFIFPYLLFSSISGQICDKYEKSDLMRKIKILEIIIMLAGGTCFILGAKEEGATLLLGILFLMGTQSTMFGPLKYSILPQHLDNDELLAGNSLTSGGTFLTILLGMIIGGLLVNGVVLEKFSTWPVGITVVCMAVLGWLASLFIPRATPSDPNSKIKWNIFKETWTCIRESKANEYTFWSIMGISWFWFFGFFFVASLPSYTRDILGGNETVATFLNTYITIGMGIGSILCNRLSEGKIKLGLVFLGAVGLTLFSLDMYLVGPTKPANLVASSYLDLKTFFTVTANWRISLDLILIGLSGGLFIVPLYTLMQQKCPRERASRVIASNNIVNALFMVSAAAFAISMFSLGLNILQIFLIVSIMNALVAAWIFKLIPIHIYHIVSNLIFGTFYRFKVTGAENIPDEGPVILVSNHVSFVDPFLVAKGCPRPPRFVMDKDFFDMKILKWFFLTAEAIPITPKKQDPHALDRAFELIEATLLEGNSVALFPEGFITKDGEMIPFKDGIERVLKRVPNAVVVPVAIKGMWGSWFSRKAGKALHGVPPKRFMAKIELNVGNALQASQVTANTLFEMVRGLRGDAL